MKKTTLLYTTAITVTFALLFTSCQSTKTETAVSPAPIVDEIEEVSNESYSADLATDEATEESVSDAYEEYDEYTTSDSEKETGSLSEGKKKSLFTFGNVDKFILRDGNSLFVPNAFGKPIQTAYSLTIEPNERLAGFGSKYLLAYYIITMDDTNRRLYSQAVKSYLMDFENKKLERKSRKSFKAYGTGSITAYWGSIKTSTPNYGNGRCYFGYKFVDNSPYFTITIPEVYNLYFENVNKDAEPASMNLTYYFTKAQAKALIELLNENDLNEVFNDYIIHEKGVYQEADSY